MEPLEVKDSVEQAVKAARHKKLTRMVAILTSIFAFMAAISGLMSARCSTRGIVAKNEAIFMQGLVTDTWAFFQSRNIRKELTDILEKVAPKHVEKQDERERFKKERDDLFAKAKAYEVDRDQWNSKSVEYLDVSKTFASAMTFLQVAVVLIPLNIILESLILLFTGSLMGFVGITFMIISYKDYFHIL
jgi:hypothetical protein